MHLLAAQPGTVSDGSEAVDLGQTAGDIVFLSAADTELACLAAAYDRLGDGVPTLRLASLLQLAHNLSVDLHVEQVVATASPWPSFRATTSLIRSWRASRRFPPRPSIGCGSTASTAAWRMPRGCCAMPPR